MSTPESAPSPKPYRPLAPRRRPERVLLVAVILMVVLGAYQFHAEGYAFLLSSQQEPSDSKLVMLRCSYFTGTEKIINHTLRAAGDSRGAPKCPFFVHLNLKPQNPYEIDIPGQSIPGQSIPGSGTPARVIPGTLTAPPATPSEAPAPPVVEPSTPSAAPPKP